MIAQEERRKVLDMVANGQLTAAEAAELLAAAAGGPEAETPEASKEDVLEYKEAEAAEHAPEAETLKRPPATTDTGGSSGPRWLRVRVEDLKSGQRKVQVNIPLGLVRFGVQMGRGWVPEMTSIDWDELSAAVASGEDGILVDVQDDEDGEHVQIYVE